MYVCVRGNQSDIKYHMYVCVRGNQSDIKYHMYVCVRGNTFWLCFYDFLLDFGILLTIHFLFFILWTIYIHTCMFLEREKNKTNLKSWVFFHSINTKFLFFSNTFSGETFFGKRFSYSIRVALPFICRPNTY